MIQDLSVLQVLNKEPDLYFPCKNSRKSETIEKYYKTKKFAIFCYDSVSYSLKEYLTSCVGVEVVCIEPIGETQGSFLLKDHNWDNCNVISLDTFVQSYDMKDFVAIIQESTSEDYLKGFLIISGADFNQIYTLFEFTEYDMFFDKFYKEYINKVIIFNYYHFGLYEKENVNSNYDYYIANIDKLNMAYSLLADEQSKYIFMSQLLFYGNKNIGLEERIYYAKRYIDCETERQYFDEFIVPFKENGVFFDCGCFTSDSAIKYSEIVRGKYKAIYSFEPSELTYSGCQVNSLGAMLHDHTIIQKGVYDEVATLKFNAGGGAGASIHEQGSSIITTTTIDIVVDEYNIDSIDFIKMDIEGAEVNALLGSANSIKKFKPNLAICVYHKPSDLFEIPLLIHELNPDYKIKLRSYRFIKDLICYATL